MTADSEVTPVGLRTRGLGPSFQWYWSAVAVSSTGSAVSSVVIPIIAAVDFHASPDDMAVLVALGLVPSLLLQVVIGAWADRVSSRVRGMVIVDIVSAVLISLVPLLWWQNSLQFPVLAAITGSMSLVGVFRLSFTSPVVAEVVSPDDFVSANGKINGTESAADVIGKALGGGLIAIMTAPFAVLADTLSYLVSAVLASRITTDRSGTDTKSNEVDAEGKTGSTVHIIRRVLSRLDLWCIVPIAFGNGISETVITIFCIRTLGIRPSILGLLLSLGAAGGILGGFMVGRINHRFGDIGVFLGMVMSVWALLPLALSPRSAFSALAVINFELAGAFGGTIIIATVFGNIQRAVSPRAISRAVGVGNNVLQASALIGVLIGGVIAEAFDTRAAIITAVALVGVTSVPLALYYKRSKEGNLSNLS